MARKSSYDKDFEKGVELGMAMLSEIFGGAAIPEKGKKRKMRRKPRVHHKDLGTLVTEPTKPEISSEEK